MFVASKCSIQCLQLLIVQLQQLYHKFIDAIVA